ncbi:MAG: protein kinase, partial [candidate division NC10 bacterium]
MVGKTISHFRILEKIGQGGMGEVFLAQDTSLDRKVALKFLPEEMQGDPTARKRFLREAKSAAALDHPYICHIHEVGEVEGKSFIAMEYIQGMMLSQKLMEGPLPLKKALETSMEIAEALEAAHKNDIVHRDLKPSNIMLTPEGHVKVMDFGLAKRLTSVEGQDEEITTKLTKDESILGTIPYMSPEQLRGREVDARSDIFSFGVVLYEMLAGVHPFKRGGQIETAHAILSEIAPPLSRYAEDIPVLLQHTVKKMLAKDPDQRYQSIHEVRTNLGQLLTATPQPAGVEFWVERGRSRLWRVAALLCSLLLLGAGWWFLSEEATVISAGQITSIAVLPLDNLMGDPEQEYFVDGMTEALIADLAQIKALKVISRTSAMRYKDTGKSAPEIGRELNVDGIVEGSVLRAGDRVRITAQLIHAATDQHLWANSYERDLKDTLFLQSEVAQAIAREIKTTLAPGEETLLARARPINPEAFEAYLKGRSYWNRRAEDGVTRALEYFQEAIDLDPTYPLAYTGLADSWIARGWYSISPPEEAYSRAEAAARRALELDDRLAEAHTSLALIKLEFDWDWPGAEKEFQRAIELNPGYAQAHQWYGGYLSAMGRLEQAIAEAKRARELDPLSPIVNTWLGLRFYFAGQHDLALEQYRTTADVNPSFQPVYWHRGWLYEEMGRSADALADYQKAVSLSGGHPLYMASLAQAYALTGDTKQAKELLQDLKVLSNRRYVPSYQIAATHLRLGETDLAFEWFERAYQERSPRLAYISVEPRLNSLRDDPRFQDLLLRM